MVKVMVVGSFDPFTLGHSQLVSSALKIGDSVDIVVAQNLNKKYFLPQTIRIECIEQLYVGSEYAGRVNVVAHDGLVTDYCEKNDIDLIVKGIRNSFDFEYEKNMAIMNKKLCGVETFFVITNPDLQHISSTLVRELFMLGADISELVPPYVFNLLGQLKKDGKL